MSTNVPTRLVGTAQQPRSYIARHFGSPSAVNFDDFENWMAASWCSEETIRRLAGV